MSDTDAPVLLSREGDVREGVSAFLAKRKPTFQGR